jgi:hypothetical protein
MIPVYLAPKGLGFAGGGLAGRAFGALAQPAKATTKEKKKMALFMAYLVKAQQPA